MLHPEHSFRVVDVHTRLDPDGVAYGLARYGDPDELEREMLQAGVVKSIVFPATDPETDDAYLAANNAVARLSVDRPFVSFARVTGSQDPDQRVTARLRSLAGGDDRTHTTPTDVQQFHMDDRFVGVVLHPSVDGVPREAVLEALAAAGMPVLVHAGPDFPPAAVEEHLLGRGFDVIIGNLRGHAGEVPLAREAIGLLADHDRCFLETGLIRNRAAIERALLEHPDRVCFGSGAPTVHPNVGLMEVLTVDVSEDIRRRVFSTNATSVVPALGPE